MFSKNNCFCKGEYVEDLEQGIFYLASREIMKITILIVAIRHNISCTGPNDQKEVIYYPLKYPRDNG